MKAIPHGHEAVLAAIEAAANSCQFDDELTPMAPAPKADLEPVAAPADPFNFPENFSLPELVEDEAGLRESLVH